MKRSDGTGARRRGIKDTWNAFMVEGAEFDVGDIPVCPTTAGVLPGSIISWPEAKRRILEAIAQVVPDCAL